MRFFVFVLIFTLFINADYLNTKTRNHCIVNLTPYQDHKGWCYHDQNSNRDVCDSRLRIDQLIDGYYLDDDGNCVLMENLRITGLTMNQWNYMMAVLAHVIGFTLVFLLSFLTILIARH